MQGDYMALNFAIGLEIAAAQASAQSPRERETEVVIRRDATGVGQLVRLQNGQPLAEGERRLRVQNVPSRWGGLIVQVSTDAWFFQEGEGGAVRQGPLWRVPLDSSGQALLVGMRDEQLEAAVAASGVWVRPRPKSKTRHLPGFLEGTSSFRR